MKWCNSCKEDRPDFSFSYCNPCMAARARRWRINNLERARAADKERWQLRSDESKEKHRKTSREWRKKNLNKKADYERARRARKLGSLTALYTRDEVYVRDEGVCYLCTLPIDLSLKWPNSMSFSVDHKIPLSKGGDDTLENVGATHLCCNISKKDKVFGKVGD